MDQAVVVGVDGSARSAAAADWAAQAARRSGRPLRMLYVAGAEPESASAGTFPLPVAAVREVIADRYPEVELRCERTPGDPKYVLAAAGERSGLLVLGSRALGAFGGTLVGSVGLGAAAHSRCPVVLVRAGAANQGGYPGEVVVGVEGGRPCDAVLGFAFAQAAERGVVLRAVESRTQAAGRYRTEAPMEPWEIRDAVLAAEETTLRDALARWREKYPAVRTVAEVVPEPAAKVLTESSRAASLLVLGRRSPGHPMAAPHLGPVAHAVLHHAHCPVAVVPHD
ncbi:universal stress protein [Kitasatospora sp. NPDC002227]|uniref:universal stress protein n=1 Tax=Kitasatospora sp. NPDC002227 TaxID=3154773 RepID=UPI00331A5B6C